MNDMPPQPMAALKKVARRLTVQSRQRGGELIARLRQRLSDATSRLGARYSDATAERERNLSKDLREVAGSPGAFPYHAAGERRVKDSGQLRTPSDELPLMDELSSLKPDITTVVTGVSNELPVDQAHQASAVSSDAGGSSELPLVAPEEPPLDLPWAYDDDRTVLLVRDPRTLYVYWDFHPDTIRRALEGLTEPRTVLRLLKQGGSEPRIVRELDIHLDSRSWYLYDCEPNRDYRVQIVAVGKGGTEALVGRASNVATLPPNTPSEWIEDRFASLPLDVPLSSAAIFLQGRLTGGDPRMHRHAFQLSGGDAHTGDEASSSRGIVQGFGGRSWSGTLVRK